MLKKAMILVEIQADAEPGNSGTQKILLDSDEGIFKIVVVPDGLQQVTSLGDTLAHELGHAFGLIMGTKASKDDPRTALPPGLIGMAMEFMPHTFRTTIIASEREAWEIGKKIYPDVNPKAAERALATYEKIPDK